MRRNTRWTAVIAAVTVLTLPGIRAPAQQSDTDWREGEKIAQSGIGMQFNDDPRRAAGGNCYACHELSPKELSFGTIGPSLRAFGKTRGSSPEMQRYVYVKIYNAQAFGACSTMPRFGHKGILSEAQIAHLVALLIDPASPVNQ